MTDRHESREKPDYEVGYGKPPKNRRFEKGRSGNPAGRPKGAKNKPKGMGKVLYDVLRQELGREVELRGANGPEVVPIVQAGVRSLAVQAAKGHVRAGQSMIALQRDLDAHDTAEREREDQILIDARNRQFAKRASRRREGLPEDDIIPDPDHIVFDMTVGRMVLRGPANLTQKIELDRMLGAKYGYEFEVQKARRKLARLAPRHEEERQLWQESLEEHEYWVTFTNLKIMTAFRMEAWQVTEEGIEQKVLEERVRQARWPEPPAVVKRGRSRAQVNALRRGEILIDVIALDERRRKRGFPPLSYLAKPAAQVALELQQEKRLREDNRQSVVAVVDAVGISDPPDEPRDTSWIDEFSMLSRMSAELRTRLESASTVMSFPAGSRVFVPGQGNETVFTVISGTVRVQRSPEDGRILPPFILERGAVSVLLLSSEMGFEDYGADGTAETDVIAVAIPTEAFFTAFEESPGFRMFVFEN